MGSIEKEFERLHANEEQELDALVVGAGFGGAYQLKHLRENGYSVKLVESGSDFGGVWYWNRYPGARVDSPTPHYEFSDPALWEKWHWTERFPDSVKLRAYFEHMAKVWDLRKDCSFNTTVISADWSEEEARWVVRTTSGKVYKAKFLLPNVGFAAKRHIPAWEGIESFRGLLMHPSYWPHEEPELRGKKIAIVGTGATGVQLAQALAAAGVGELVVFQRTPSTCLPMRQERYGPGEGARPRAEYPGLFARRRESFGGFDYNFLARATFDDDAAARRAVYERLWAEGDFKFWLATYHDMLFDDAANTEAYNFWRDKTRARIRDPRLRELLAPLKKPYSFGCKRIPLEDGYYEIFGQENVRLVDINETPIERVTERGIRTSAGEMEFDIIISATGYDAMTGGLAQMGIRGRGGESLADHWRAGVRTHLGMATAGFPNLFFTYGPQAPTAFCNGPTCAQLQGDWIIAVMNRLRDAGLRAIAADRDSEEAWRENVSSIAHRSLLPGTKSWYMGDNIPGKPRVPLVFLGGVPAYYKILSEVAEADYEGFTMS